MTAARPMSGEAEIDWGRVALICLFGGMGAALLATICAALIVWWNGFSQLRTVGNLEELCLMFCAISFC
jgi:hypothetical protein